MVEVESARTEVSKTFSAEGSDVYLTEVYPQAVHFPNAEGSMVEIDTTLVPVQGGSSTEFEAAATPLEVAVDARADAAALASVSDPSSGVSVSFGLAEPGDADVSAPDGSTVVVDDASAGVAAELEVLAAGVKETVTLDGRASPSVLSYRLDVAGATPQLTDAGGIDFVADGSGEVALGLPRGWMRDASGVLSDGVSYTLVPSSGFPAADADSRWDLGVVLDAGWLADPGRVWPVVVDPILAALDSQDTTITEGISADQSTDSTIRAGFDGGAKNRALTLASGTVHYPDESTGTIFSPVGTEPETMFAAMVFEAHDCSADPADFQLQGLSSSWSPSAVTWANAPSLSGRLDTGATTVGIDPSCVSDKRQWAFDVTAYFEDLQAQSVTYNGIALVAGDESGTAEVEFTAADSQEPTTTGGVIRWWYRDAAAEGQPDPPTGVAPDGLVDTLTPDRSGYYESPDADTGYVLYLVRDDTGTAINVGMDGSSAVNPGELSGIGIGEGILEWDRTYTLDAWSVRSDNGPGVGVGEDLHETVDNASAKATTTFTTTSARLTQPPPESTVFGDETIEVTSAGAYSIDEVDFYVDEALVDTDTNGGDGWTADWDTTAETDGAHTVRVVITDTGTATYDTPTHAVTVDNTLDRVQRVQEDLDRGLIDLDSWARHTVEIALGDDEAPDRYSAGSAGIDSVDYSTALFAVRAIEWDGLSTQTKGAVAALLALPTGSGTSGSGPGCLGDHVVVDEAFHGRDGPWCLTDFPSSGTGVPAVDMYYKVDSGDPAESFDWVSDDDVDSDGIPDQVESYVLTIQSAWETYVEAGYEPILDNEDAFPVGIYGHQGDLLARAAGYTAEETFITLDPDADASVAAHEAFHLAHQPVLGDHYPRPEMVAGWLMESTGRWAPSFYAGQAGTSLGDVTAHTPAWDPSFADSLLALDIEPDRWVFPNAELVTPRREYGSAALWQYLSERYAPRDIVAELFAEMDCCTSGAYDLFDLLEVEDLLDEPIDDVVADFWVAMHLLEDENSATPEFNWALPSSDVDDWRSALGDDGPSVLDADAFGPERLERRLVEVDAEGTEEEFAAVASGGALAIDVIPEPGHAGDLEVTVDRTRGSDPVVVTAVGYDATGHPHICRRDPGEQSETVELAQWTLPAGPQTLSVDSTCRTVTVFVANVDPRRTEDSGGALNASTSIHADVEISFTDTSAEAWLPVAAIDGDEVGGLVPGAVVQIQSFPTEVGPRTGNVCVYVEAVAGSGTVLGDVFPTITVRNGVTQTSLQSIAPFDSAIGVAIGKSSRVYSFGSIAEPDPWVSLSVDLVETLGDVESWSTWAASC